MKEQEHKGWEQFLKLVRDTGSSSQLDEMLSFFLTLEEKETIATRVLLVKELLKTVKTQREIAHDLNISIAKITRGSNALKTISPELKKFLLDFVRPAE